MNPLYIFPVVLLLYLANSIKILPEYERGVIFRLGKLLPQPKGPGVVLVFAPIDRMVRVGLRTIVMDVPSQDIITRDNVSVKVNAVIYFRVMDPNRAIVEVESFHYATGQLAQTTLRSVLGQVDLDGLLSDRDLLNRDLQKLLDQHTAQEDDDGHDRRRHRQENQLLGAGCRLSRPVVRHRGRRSALAGTGS